MVAKPEVLALIPARGGSKGIPRKNLREFAGAPLIAYSITAALQADLVTRVIVSTDDAGIAETARAWGAETPFVRPAEFAQDDSTDLPVFQHAFYWLWENEGYRPDMVVQLRPTSPVRPRGLVDEAIRKMSGHPDADCVRGVVPSTQNPYKMWQIDAEGSLEPLLSLPGVPEPYNAPRQSLPPTYWQTGHIDVIRTETILEKKSLTGDVLIPILIDPLYTVDIDTPADLQRYAQLMGDSRLDPVDPLKQRRKFPARVSYLVMDFDGVMTDDKVYVDQDGRESVRCSRSDGSGIHMLRANTSIHPLIISREKNPVVSARAKKLDIEVCQAVFHKDQVIQALVQERKLDKNEIIFVGNDLPDLVVIPYVGFFACPSDAQPEVLRRADLVLCHKGGDGAIRELVEIILNKSEIEE